jgi:hypothetical protein
MNKEKLLQLLSDLIDRGASISVYVPQFDKTDQWPWHKVTKEEALQMAERAQDAIDAPVEEEKGEYGFDHLVVTNEEKDIRFCFSYHPYMVEDVKLDGGEEIAG